VRATPILHPFNDPAEDKVTLDHFYEPAAELGLSWDKMADSIEAGPTPCMQSHEHTQHVFPEQAAAPTAW
jgi:hypothetical protein